MNKKRFFLGGCVILPLIFITIYFQFHLKLKERFHAENSVNPVATNYFAHAMLISMGEKFIHDYFFINYDSFLFAPLHSLQEQLFSKGSQHINSENTAEEAVWWGLIHIDKYGLLKSGRQDRSLVKKDLLGRGSVPLREKAFQYFNAVVDEGVKGINFGGFEYLAAYGLSEFPFYKISTTYSGKTEDERIDQYWSDHENYSRSLLVYNKYKKLYRKDPKIGNKIKAVIGSIVDRLSHLIYFNIVNNNENMTCGQLLDDYLLNITSSELDIKQLGNNGIDSVNIILKHLREICFVKQEEIIRAQIHFQKNGGK